MKLQAKARHRGDPRLANAAFRRVLEDHLTYFRNHPQLRSTRVTPQQADMYRGDFYGLLIELGVPEEMHWITLRINHLHSPGDYQEEKTEIYAMPSGVVTKILNMHLSRLKQL